MPFSRDGKECFSVEVGKLLGKGAMRRASFDINQFLSNQFKIPKKGDELRPVINLKPLNHFVEYHHFKMEGLSSPLVLINPNVYMITMDLKDASYRSRSMPITRNIYFFEWKSELWEFSCLPFELSSAPRVFTKVMKLLIGKIRSQGIRSVIDLDDMAVSETVSADPVSGLHNWLVKYNVLFASGKAKQTNWKGLGHLTPF